MTFKFLTFSHSIALSLSHPKTIFISALVNFTDFHPQHPSLQPIIHPNITSRFYPRFYTDFCHLGKISSVKTNKFTTSPTKSFPLVFNSLLISQIRRVIQQIQTKQLKLQHTTISFGKHKNFGTPLNMLEFQHFEYPNFAQSPKITINSTIQKLFQKIYKKRFTFQSWKSIILLVS